MANLYDIKGRPVTIWGNYTDKMVGDSDILRIYGHNVAGGGNGGRVASFVLEIKATITDVSYDNKGILHGVYRGVQSVHFHQDGISSAGWDSSTHVYANNQEVWSNAGNAGRSVDSGWINVGGISNPISFDINPNGDQTNINQLMASFLNYPVEQGPNPQFSDKWEFYFVSVKNNYRLLFYVPMAIADGNGHLLSLNTHDGVIKEYDGQNIVYVGQEKIDDIGKQEMGKNRILTDTNEKPIQQGVINDKDV